MTPKTPENNTRVALVETRERWEQPTLTRLAAVNALGGSGCYDDGSLKGGGCKSNQHGAS
jgi:hypothetical protein